MPRNAVCATRSSGHSPFCSPAPTAAPMHELSIAAGILQRVEELAQQEGFCAVEELHLEVGQLSGVETESLRFALQSMVGGSLLAGARIRIAEQPGRAWCGVCNERVEVESRAQVCPRCGRPGLSVLEGTGLRLVDLLVRDPA